MENERTLNSTNIKIFDREDNSTAVLSFSKERKEILEQITKIIPSDYTEEIIINVLHGNTFVIHGKTNISYIDGILVINTTNETEEIRYIENNTVHLVSSSPLTIEEKIIKQIEWQIFWYDEE